MSEDEDARRIIIEILRDTDGFVGCGPIRNGEMDVYCSTIDCIDEIPSDILGVKLRFDIVGKASHHQHVREF